MSWNRLVVVIALCAVPSIAQQSDTQQKMQREMGGQITSFVQVHRLEYQTNDGDGRFLWEGEGWVGTDKHKLWFKSEGLYLLEQPSAITSTPNATIQSLVPRTGRIGGGRIRPTHIVVGPHDPPPVGPGEPVPPVRNTRFPAEVQALYSRPISAYFDVQAGVRQDLAVGARRTFGVIGVQGVLPYWFDVDTALFVSNDGDTSARIEVEYDLRFTQRLILQPRTELNFAFQDVARLAIDRGLVAAEASARFRYEVSRQFAPYVGVAWRKIASEPNRVSLVAGLSLWF